MAVLETLCPRCGENPLRDNSVPEDGSLFNCGACGFLGIWATHYWREPTDDERMSLLHNRTVLDAQYIPIIANMRMSADVDRMREVLHRYLAMLRAGTISMDEMVDKTVIELKGWGFHSDGHATYTGECDHG